MGFRPWPVQDGVAYTVTVFSDVSDVSDRDGLGWELTPAGRPEVLAEVFRSDAGAIPELTRTKCADLDPKILDRLVQAAVPDLLRPVTGELSSWLISNLGAALALSGRRVTGWQGMEWALEEGEPTADPIFSPPGAPRVPYAWLRCHLHDTSPVTFETYQDDGAFGIGLLGQFPRELHEAAGDLRPHPDIGLPTGPVDSVKARLDTTLKPPHIADVGLLSEIELEIAGQPILLIAAEAYGADEWHLYDESVVVVRDPSIVNQLSWIPPRPQ